MNIVEVILLEKVHKLGAIGDKVSVKPGYGRNFLIPQGIAILATKDNLVEFEKRRAELERIAAEKLAQAEARKAILHEASITIIAKAGDEGKMFGSVGTMDIVDALAAAGHTIEKSELRMPEGAIREVGEYSYDVHLGSDVVASIKVIIEAEKSDH